MVGDSRSAVRVGLEFEVGFSFQRLWPQILEQIHSFIPGTKIERLL